MVTCTPAEENAILKELPKLNQINRNVLRKASASIGQDKTSESGVGEQIKNQIEQNKIEKENRLKTLRKRLKIGNEDVEDPEKLVPLIKSVASTLGKDEEYQDVQANFHAIVEKNKEMQKRLESQNISAFEQSHQVINMKYELTEIFYKPLGQLATELNEDFGTALRHVFSLVTRIHEISQTYLIAATEMGGESGGGSKGTKGGIMDSMNMEKEVWMLRRGEMEKELLNLREENKKCYDLITRLSKDQVEGLRTIKTIDSKTQSKSNLTFLRKDEENQVVKVQNIKALSVNQLNDVIKDIMHTKKEYDAKNMANGLVRETLEQYLYTYLTNRYGLKNIVVNWATSIICMIGQHSKTDNLILVFGKILRNEIEEEFFYEQEKTIKTIRRLLESYLRAKSPMKSTAEIKSQRKEVTEGLVSRQQCLDLIQYLYAGKDVKAVEVLVDHLFAESVHEVVPPGNNYKPKIMYKSFEKIVLDYQMSAHEDRLSNFRDIYNGLDVDKKGFLVGDDIIKLLEQMRMRKCQFDVAQAKSKIDPIKSQKATFSTLVEVLHNIHHEGSHLSLIQKLGKFL